jgi:hypothetical protein
MLNVITVNRGIAAASEENVPHLVPSPALQPRGGSPGWKGQRVQLDVRTGFDAGHRFDADYPYNGRPRWPTMITIRQG